MKQFSAYLVSVANGTTPLSFTLSVSLSQTEDSEDGSSEDSDSLLELSESLLESSDESEEDSVSASVAFWSSSCTAAFDVGIFVFGVDLVSRGFFGSTMDGACFLVRFVDVE